MANIPPILLTTIRFDHYKIHLMKNIHTVITAITVLMNITHVLLNNMPLLVTNIPVLVTNIPVLVMGELKSVRTRAILAIRRTLMTSPASLSRFFSRNPEASYTTWSKDENLIDQLTDWLINWLSQPCWSIGNVIMYFHVSLATVWMCTFVLYDWR